MEKLFQMKTFTSNSKLHNYLTCEFSAHGIVDNMQECTDSTTNGFNFQITDSSKMNVNLGDMLDLA